MNMIIDNKFSIGDTVYLKTDTDQKPRLVIAFFVSKQEIKYLISCGKEDKYFYDIEISEEINYSPSTQ